MQKKTKTAPAKRKNKKSGSLQDHLFRSHGLPLASTGGAHRRATQAGWLGRRKREARDVRGVHCFLVLRTSGVFFFFFFNFCPPTKRHYWVITVDFFCFF